MDAQQTRNILEACLLVAGRAMSVAQLEALFESDIDRPDRKEIKLQLEELQKTYEGRGIELIEVASGWRLQSRSSMEHWVSRLFTEKSPRYSRALLETLVLIAYRQPITRGEIEEIRGVAVSSNIIRTLQEREWVKEVGHKEVPGRPALLGTTRQFLDYFNLKRLDELPPLSEIKDLEEIDATLAAEMGVAGAGEAGAGEAGAGEAGAGEAGAGEAGLEADGSGVAGPSEADVGEADVGEANADDVGDTENEIAEINIEGAGGHGVDESDQGSVNETANDVSDSSEDQGDADSATAGDAQTDVDDDDDDDDDDDISLKSDAEKTLADTDTEDDSSEDDSSDDNTIESELLSEDEGVEEADGDDVDSETSDAQDDEGSDETPDADSTDTEAGSDPENDALGELDPQTELRRVISEFADEHQRELDVQKDLDSRNLTTVDDSPDDDNIGADDASDSDTESSAVKNKALAVELVGEHDVMSLNQNPDLEPADDVVSDASSDAIADTANATEPEP